MQDILKRLGYRPGDRALMLDAPQVPGSALAGAMSPQPDSAAEGLYPFVMAFVTDLAQFEQRKAGWAAATASQGRLWVCYPKKSSKRFKTDVSRDVLWPLMGELGFEPVSQYALDEDWSAMRFRPVGEIKCMVRKSAATQEGARRAELEREKMEKAGKIKTGKQRKMP